MKNRTPLNTAIGLAFLIAAAIVSCIMLASCSMLGTNPSAPTKGESLLFDTVTNYVTIIKTNEVPVAVWSTNQITLTITNQQNQLVTTVSNVVNAVWHTNEVVGTSQQPQYTETLKPSATSVIQAGGSALSAVVPGLGGLLSSGLIALLGGWGYLRSQKKGTVTTTALAQEIETIRTFVQALPNGQSYDTALVSFLQSHQAETGIAQSVASVLENAVSNPDAKVAAQEVINAINALKSTTTPIAPVIATPA